MSEPIIIDKVNSKFENVSISGSTITLTRGNGDTESVTISTQGGGISGEYLPLSAGVENVVSGEINLNADTTYNSTKNCIVEGYDGTLGLFGGNNSTAKAVVCATKETENGHYKGGILQVWRDDYPDNESSYYAGAVGLTGQNSNQRVTIRINPLDDRSFVFHNTDQGGERGNHNTNVVFLNNGFTNIIKDDATNFIRIVGGGDNNNTISGGNVMVYGANCSQFNSRKGCVRLQYNDGTNTNAVFVGKDNTEFQNAIKFTKNNSIEFNNGTSSASLSGTVNGNLTWTGKVISCTSFAGTATNASSLGGIASSEYALKNDIIISTAAASGTAGRLWIQYI